MTKTVFLQLPDGQTAYLYRLVNAHGLRATITNFGGIVTSIETPDRQGHMADVVLHWPAPTDYLHNTTYFGALIGRYANRIAGGHFTLDGHRYTLPINNGPNTLHGGTRGFDQHLWTVREATPTRLVLTTHSPDGEEGFPGAMDVQVTYTLTDDDALRIDYQATTDKDTVVNLTNHCYFNLNGDERGDILDHVLQIDADRFTPVDANLIPTGALESVAGTPFDFRTPTRIGARIRDNDQQLRYGKGYDHNFVLAERARATPQRAATVYDPATGRTLEVWTDQPGLQFYSGNYLATPNTGFALESQHFPDSPNHPNFPTTELKPGQVFRSTTLYKFGVRPGR